MGGEEGPLIVSYPSYPPPPYLSWWPGDCPVHWSSWTQSRGVKFGSLPGSCSHHRTQRTRPQRAPSWSAWLSARQAPSPLQLLLQSKPPPTCTFIPAPRAPGVADTACLAHGDASTQLQHPKDNCPLPTWPPYPCILTSHLSPTHHVVPSGAAPRGLNTWPLGPLLPATSRPENHTTAKCETRALKVGGDEKSRDHGKNLKRPTTSMLGKLCRKGYSRMW